MFYTGGRNDRMIITNTGTLNVLGLALLNTIVTYNNTSPDLTAVNNATSHSIINVFPVIDGQVQGNKDH